MAASGAGHADYQVSNFGKSCRRHIKGGKWRIFKFFESASIKAFAGL
jgi:hypothetical protein